MKVVKLVYDNNKPWGYVLDDGKLISNTEARANITKISNLVVINDVLYETEKLGHVTYQEASNQV